MAYVAYSGGGPAQAALLGNQVTAGISGYAEFAEQIKAGPWYDVIALPGFRIGSTDPQADPKGKLALQALLAAGGADVSICLL